MYMSQASEDGLIFFLFSIQLRPMYTLAFETSCDDTSVALLRDDVLLALSTRTQLEHDAT